MVKVRRRFGRLDEPKLYRPACRVTFQVAAPRNFTPVVFATPGPTSRKPSVAVRSVTVTWAAPGASPAGRRSANAAAPGPIDPASFAGAGAAGAEKRDERRDEEELDRHARHTVRPTDWIGHARRTAPKRSSRAATIRLRSSPASSSVSVRSGEPKATLNATDRLPSPIC